MSTTQSELEDGHERGEGPTSVRESCVMVSLLVSEMYGCVPTVREAVLGGERHKRACYVR